MHRHRWAGPLVVGLAMIALIAGCSAATTTRPASPPPAVTASRASASNPTAIDVASLPPSPLPSMPPALIGVWAAEAGLPALTLKACAAGEVCGRFERVDDNAEHCVYTLEYRPPTTDRFVFWSADANSFGCGYSPWSRTEYLVRPMPDGSVAVTLGNLGSVTLGAVGSPPAPSADPSGGG